MCECYGYSMTSSSSPWRMVASSLWRNCRTSSPAWMSSLRCTVSASHHSSPPHPTASPLPPGLIYPEPTHPLSACPRQPGLLLGTTRSRPLQHTPQRYRHTRQAHEVCMTAHQPQGSNTQLQPEPAAAQTRRLSLLGSSKAPPFLRPTALFLDCLMKRRQESGYLIEEIGDVLLARVRWPHMALDTDSPPCIPQACPTLGFHF